MRTRRWLENLRFSLGAKLFLSYVIVLAVSGIMLAVMVQLQLPAALDRHIQRMASHLIADPGLEADLYINFTDAINEITIIAAIVALVGAVLVSIFTTRRILLPIRAMMRASQEIAAGQFDQRVPVSSEDELGELAKSFNQMATELEQTDQRRLALIGDIAHELRTPLSNIRSVMEGLVDGVLSAEAETFLGVEHEVMRLQRLVRDLQELSRAEAGEFSLELRQVGPAPLAVAAAERLRLQYEDKDVELQVAVPDHLSPVLADPSRMVQVLLNLLGNALQYTESGGRVEVSAREKGEMVAFAVSDTGLGLAPEQLPHIFERFYRVDKSRSRASGGSGIGLTISKHIVEAHGGCIWAESEGIGRGSVFLFVLPKA